MFIIRFLGGKRLELIINKPYIDKNRIVSVIEYEKNKYDLYFEVNNEYVKYLCTENANAFLLALLPLIVKNSYDVIVKASISSRLYYQLTTYLLPMLEKAFNKREITIKCELTDCKYDGDGVGASVSCGIDSFYTLFKHMNLKDNKMNITHLCFFNAGSNGSYGGEDSRKLFKERVTHIKDFCAEMNMHLVEIDSNLNELLMMSHEIRHTFTTLSCVYVLEKLFNTYYFASGMKFDGSHIDRSDTSFYDILNVQCLSNENITFYCSGIETSRMEKTKYISNYDITYKYLNVCTKSHWNNCGKCIKCVRTMTSLESIKKLEKYGNVFDLEEYRKNRNIILSKLLVMNRDKIQHEFCSEIINSYKDNNVKIPLVSYLLSFLPSKKNIKALIKFIIPSRLLNKLTGTKNKVHNGWDN